MFGSSVGEMFSGASSCPSQDDPILTSSPKGPFCHECLAPSAEPSVVPSPTPSVTPTFPGACQSGLIRINAWLKITLNTFYLSGSVPDKVRVSGRCQFRRVWI